MGTSYKNPPFLCPSHGPPGGLRPPVAAELRVWGHVLPLRWERAMPLRQTALVLDSMVHLVPPGVFLVPLRLSRAEASEVSPSQLSRAEGQEE
eukprot:9502365-Pyramimonas_sp.AAC.1